jgi:HSP20 family protein
MALARWDPFREIAALERQFDEMFGRLNRSGGQAREGGGWMPMVDVHQDGDDMVVRAELAGVAPENVDITVENSMLRLSGSRDDDQQVEEGNWIRRERFSGRFERQIALPQGVDPDGISATAKDGVVEIRVPCPRSAEPHRVQLQTDDRSSGQESSEQGADGTTPIDVTAAKGEASTSGRPEPKSSRS